MFGQETPEGTYQGVYSKWQQSSATEISRVWYTSSERKAYDKIVVTESIRVSLTSEIFCDGTILEGIVSVDHELSSACVEPQDVIK